MDTYSSPIERAISSEAWSRAIVACESDGAAPASPLTVGRASSWVLLRVRTASGSAPGAAQDRNDDAAVLLEQRGE